MEKMRMNLFIDCEFGGKLISMAIVSEDGKEFYEVLPCEIQVIVSKRASSQY
jgi:hypothetical protein